jgi:two-component system chemotaxis sensor kinase CheA
MAAAHTGTQGSEEMVKALAETSGQQAPPISGKAARPAVTPAPAAPAPAAVKAAPPPGPAPAAAAPAPARPEEETPAPAAGAPKTSVTDRSIRVNVEILDSLGVLAGDLLVESARGRLRGLETAQLIERFSRLSDRFLRLGEEVHLSPELRRILEGIESDLHRLRDDAFRFVRRNDDGINTLHGNLAKLADTVSEARLVPLGSVFDAFPRAMRELARNQGKEVDLLIENADIGVDRSMLTDVRDALVHLLRNAVDHGLEMPDARQQLGKPPMGRVRIRVRADGDMLHIQVEDDGRGIDPERLKTVAVSRHLLTQAQAAALSEREAIDLIFRPGFSTRDQVSEISGRGVGMDVVKRKVETLGGSVGVASRIGRGTTITLRLPQSLALMKVLLVRLGDDVYGIPAADVVAVTRVKTEDRIEVFGTLAVKHRDKPIALVALGPLLGVNGGNRFDKPPAVVVRHGEDNAALVVDGFVDEREVAVKPCGGDFLKGAPFIAGTAALEDGRIAVLCHVPDIMAEVRRMARPVSQQPAAQRLRVLLVDDSPIARATEGALVKALGHTVEEAQDGEEAYAKVQNNTYDLILTDVQMPKMDGFALTRRLKSTAGMARIPVIILSSLASPEDKRRGLEAGADGYLVKGELGVESLALTIERLT